MTTFAIRINYINSVRSGWGAAKVVSALDSAEAAKIAIGDAERGCFVPRYRCADDAVEVEYEYATIRPGATPADIYRASNAVDAGKGYKAYLAI